MSANLPSDFAVRPLGGDFDMRRYARVTSAIYEAAPGMRLVPLCIRKGGCARAGRAILGRFVRGKKTGLSHTCKWRCCRAIPSMPRPQRALRWRRNDACTPSCCAVFVRSRALGRFFPNAFSSDWTRSVLRMAPCCSQSSGNLLRRPVRLCWKRRRSSASFLRATEA